MDKTNITYETKKLSSKEYWDSVLKNAKLPRINSVDTYAYRITMNFVDSVLSLLQAKTFLEIGCGSSGWLPYFAEKYGYRVSGIDYSEVGCRLAEENLKLLNIDFDEIVCQDIFEWKDSKQYDVIFSYGVVEHFDNPEVLLRIAHKHLALEGVIITLIPNNLGLVGLLSRMFVKDIYKMHKVLSRSELIECHQKVGFSVIKADYVGNFTLAVVPWSKSSIWFFREKSFQAAISLRVIYYLDRLFSTLWRLIRLEWSSKWWSPYVIAIMKKTIDDRSVGSK